MELGHGQIQVRALPQVWQALLNLLACPVAVLDAQGHCLAANGQFPMLTSAELARLAAAPAGSLHLSDDLGHVTEALLSQVGGCRIVVGAAGGAEARVLTRLVTGLQAGQDIFQAAARALGEGLGWRWAAVTRFLGVHGQAEILGWYGEGPIVPGFVYSLYGAPCERVVERDGFYATGSLQALYPGQEMGAEIYAGQVFRDREGQALGHVFVMDLDRARDLAEVERVLALTTRVIDGHMALLASEEMAARAAALGRTDALTGLGNRLAFEQELERLGRDYAEDESRDALVLVLDLDGLKAVNDRLGHAAGDALLMSFAKALPRLARANEHLYRLGGDEFAVLMPGAGPGIEARLRQGVVPVVAATRAAGFPMMDVSLGLAALSETGGDAHKALALADERMYADKQGKPRAGGAAVPRSA